MNVVTTIAASSSSVGSLSVTHALVHKYRAAMQLRICCGLQG